MMKTLVTTAAIALLVGMTFVPLIPQAEAQTASGDASPIVNFYLADESLDPNPPTSEESKQASILGNPPTPALSWIVAWGGIDLAEPITVTQDAVVTIWLTPEEANVITQLRAILYSDGSEIARGTTGTVAGTGGESLLDEPTRYQFGIPTRGMEIAGDLELRFVFFGTGASDSDVDVYALYGSTTHPSRLSVSVADPGALPTTSFGQTLFFGDETLTPAAPTSDEDKARATESTGIDGSGVTTMGTASEWDWGSYTLEEDAVLADDASLTFWLSHDGDPALLRTVRPVLYLGGQDVTQTGGVGAWEFVDAEVHAFRIAFATAGMELSAGDEIRVAFLTWSTSDSNLGEILFLYGSTAHPAGLTLRFAGASAAAPDVSVTPTPAAAEVPAGQTASFTLAIHNNGTEPVDVVLNATDPAVFVAADTAVTVQANEATSVSAQVAVPSDATVGDSLTYRIAAEVGGLEVANATLTVNVGETSDDRTPAPTDGGSDANGNATGNQTGESFDDDGGSVPAAGPVAMAVAVALAVVVASRRR